VDEDGGANGSRVGVVVDTEGVVDQRKGVRVSGRVVALYNVEAGRDAGYPGLIV